MKTTLALSIGGFAFCALLAPNRALADEEALVTSVYSHVKNGYVRAALPDGSLKRETYVVAKGGYAAGIGVNHSIDDVRFPGIVRVLGRHLARQNYQPARDPKSADLMLVIYWGRTIPLNGLEDRNAMDRAMNVIQPLQHLGVGLGRDPFDFAHPLFAAGERGRDGIPLDDGVQVKWAAQDAGEGALLELQSAQRARAEANRTNANLLGYMDEINARDDISRFAGGGTYYDDLVSDIEEERYYVVIGAYDFQAALKHNEQKLLWLTRVSIRAQGNKFNEELVAMVRQASRYFGQDSGRLVRTYERVPRIEYGELKSLGLAVNTTSRN